MIAKVQRCENDEFHSEIILTYILSFIISRKFEIYLFKLLKML